MVSGVRGKGFLCVYTYTYAYAYIYIYIYIHIYMYGTHGHDGIDGLSMYI